MEGSLGSDSDPLRRLALLLRDQGTGPAASLWGPLFITPQYVAAWVDRVFPQWGLSFAPRGRGSNYPPPIVSYSAEEGKGD